MSFPVDGESNNTDKETKILSVPIVNNSNSNRASSRKHRVYVFRDFLIEQYGPNSATDSTHDNNNDNKCYLKPGDTVLDVAGGKGDLSWLLANADGVNSIVVDPRSLSSTSHLIRSVVWLQDHPEEAGKRAIPHLPTHQPLAALIPQIAEAVRLRTKKRAAGDGQAEAEAKGIAETNAQGIESTERKDVDTRTYLEPLNFQSKLDRAFVNALRESKLQGTCGEDECPKAWKIFWENNMLESSSTNTNIATKDDDLFLPESERKVTASMTSKSALVQPPIQDPTLAWHILQSVQLVTGFHPDQATEACLELAELLRIPVCIVPCCVFPSEFPDRVLVVDTNPEDGSGDDDEGDQERSTMTTTRVRDYQQLLKYLQQEHPKLRKDTLAFHRTETSRNVVLYTLPEDIME